MSAWLNNCLSCFIAFETGLIYLAVCSKEIVFERIIMENRKSRHQQNILQNLLTDNYKRSAPPTPLKSDQPIEVSVSVILLSLSSISDSDMDFTIQLILKQSWIDKRLVFFDSSLNPDEFIVLAGDQVPWTPDSYFENEKSGHTHKIDQPNQSIRLRQDGRVEYTKRITQRLECLMDLKLYPHDKQTCSFKIGSYGLTAKDIVYHWSESEITIGKQVFGTLPKFIIESVVSGSETVAHDHGMLYIPSCMLVSVACVSFWIDWHSAPARVPLAIVTFLTIGAQANGVNANLPPVPYTRAIDVWIGACVIIIFGALVEYAIVNYVGSNEEMRKVKKAPAGCFEDENFFDPAISAMYLAPPCSGTNLKNPRTHKRNTARDQPNWREQEKPVIVATVPLAYRINRFLNRRISTKPQRGSPAYVSIGRKPTPPNSLSRATTVWEMDRSHDMEIADHSDQPIREFSDFSRRNDSGNLIRKTRADRIDEVSSFLFPVSFLLFNVVYWSMYMT